MDIIRKQTDDIATQQNEWYYSYATQVIIIALFFCFFTVYCLKSIEIAVDIYLLKTLLNIVEDLFKKLLNFDVCVV